MRSAGSYGKDIYGRYIGVDPTDLTPDLTSSEFTIVTSFDEESDPSLAYNPLLDETLLAWRNYTPPPDSYEYIIFGGNPNGSISGYVVDNLGTGIANVYVDAYNETLDENFSTTTDATVTMS